MNAWIQEKEAALQDLLSPSSTHSDAASTSGSEEAAAKQVEPVETPLKDFKNASFKDPELIEQVQKILEGVEGGDVAKMVTGTAGLKDLLEARRSLWKQVYSTGGVKVLINLVFYLFRSSIVHLLYLLARTSRAFSPISPLQSYKRIRFDGNCFQIQM